MSGLSRSARFSVAVAASAAALVGCGGPAASVGAVAPAAADGGVSVAVSSTIESVADGTGFPSGIDHDIRMNFLGAFDELRGARASALSHVEPRLGPPDPEAAQAASAEREGPAVGVAHVAASEFGTTYDDMLANGGDRVDENLWRAAKGLELAWTGDPVPSDPNDGQLFTEQYRPRDWSGWVPDQEFMNRWLIQTNIWAAATSDVYAANAESPFVVSADRLMRFYSGRPISLYADERDAREESVEYWIAEVPPMGDQQVALAEHIRTVREWVRANESAWFSLGSGSEALWGEWQTLADEWSVLKESAGFEPGF